MASEAQSLFVVKCCLQMNKRGWKIPHVGRSQEQVRLDDNVLQHFHLGIVPLEFLHHIHQLLAQSLDSLVLENAGHVFANPKKNDDDSNSVYLHKVMKHPQGRKIKQIARDESKE